MVMMNKVFYSISCIGILYPLMCWTETKPFKHVGCFRDSRTNRAFPVDSYTFIRSNNKVEACALIASNRGFSVFAVEHTIECWGSVSADDSYTRYGPSTNCRLDGKGGDLALDIYQFTDEVLWPKGTYSLLKPASGCPSDFIDNGWLIQDTVDSIKNKKSPLFNIDGYVGRGYAVRSFCTKTRGAVGVDWPAGQYCIYKEGKMIPPKMMTGSIRMDNDNKNDRQSLDNAEMVYDYGIEFYKYSFRIHFVCQTNGDKSAPIDLPTSQPFYLLPYGSAECQQVKWMIATKDWIRYGTRNYQTQPKSWRSGKTPYFNVGAITDKGLTMYYCLYVSCNHTLNDAQGVFQSPRYPDKYPDGQLCSWRIRVPVNHTVLVHFTTFYLEDSIKSNTDILELHRLINNSFVLLDIYKGHRERFNISSRSDILFVFRSDGENSSQGFKAEYNVFTNAENATKRLTGITPTTTFKDNVTEPTKLFKAGNKTKQYRNLKNNNRGTGTAVLIVIPLVCFILIVVVSVDIFCRWRLSYGKKSRRNTCRITDEQVAANPTYGASDAIQLDQFNDTSNTNTSAKPVVNKQEDTERTYDMLIRVPPKHEIPEQYRAPNTSSHLNTKSATTTQVNDSENTYHVLESPTSSGAVLDSDMYHTIDAGSCTNNKLYKNA